MPTTTKALSQISIMDLTDGYTVSLSQDSGKFTANSNHRAINATTVFTVNIEALQGSKSISNTIKIGSCIIKDASGSTVSNGTITATAASGNISPVTITIYGNSAADTNAFIGEMATVTIPIYVEGNPSNPNPNTDIVINKTFTISSSPHGEAGTSSHTWIMYAEDANGTNMSEDPSDDLPYVAMLITNTDTVPPASAFVGLWTKYLGTDGEPGTSIFIHSSNGTYFKNTGVNTRLTVHIRDANGDDQPIPNNLEWYKGDPNNGGTKVTNISHRSYIDVTPSDVTDTETYFVVLEETTA